MTQKRGKRKHPPALRVLFADFPEDRARFKMICAEAEISMNSYLQTFIRLVNVWHEGTGRVFEMDVFLKGVEDFDQFLKNCEELGIDPGDRIIELVKGDNCSYATQGKLLDTGIK